MRTVGNVSEERPTLDYRPRGADKRQFPRAKVSAFAAAVAAGSAAVGLGLRSWADRHAASFLVLPLMLGAFCYVIARVFESRSSDESKLMRLMLALVALSLACGLAFREESVFAYASAYGWTSAQAFAHPACLTLGGVLVVLAILDGVDLLQRKRRR